MNNKFLMGLVASPMLVLALYVPTYAADTADAAGSVTCKDGSTSTATGRGACSKHGGVQKAKKAKADTAAAAPAAAPAATAAAPKAAAAPAPAAAPAAAKPSVMAKSAAAPTAAAGASDPAGASAKCKDGTYSHSKHHSGTCSKHGGVAEWLTAAQ
jgi:hypothetical protein